MPPVSCPRLTTIWHLALMHEKYFKHTPATTLALHGNKKKAVARQVSNQFSFCGTVSPTYPHVYTHIPCNMRIKNPSPWPHSGPPVPATRFLQMYSEPQQPQREFNWQSDRVKQTSVRGEAGQIGSTSFCRYASFIFEILRPIRIPASLCNAFHVAGQGCPVCLSLWS